MEEPAVGVLIAHPDDEIFASNLLYALAQTEYRVFILCATSGEGGQLVGDPPLVEKQALGPYREKEMKRSISVYGVEELVFLGIEDQGNERWSENDHGFIRAEVGRTLRGLWKRYDIKYLVTHGSAGEYGHPMHQALHDAAVTIANECGAGVCTFWANNGLNTEDRHTNVDDIATFDLACSGFPYHKFRSLLAHRTQWRHFAGKQPSPEAYVEALRAYAEQHREESYRLVGNENAEQGAALIQKLSLDDRITLNIHGDYKQLWIWIRTLIWKVIKILQDLRYKLALRTRTKKLFGKLRNIVGQYGQ
jgi:LmbE family N-acetylglucosaminyl deacetylase